MRSHAAFPALFLAATTCAAPSHYAGIDLRAGSPTAPEIQTLAARARSGDKHAQLELGIRYEEGRGLPPDVKQARQLYRLAAATGGTIYVYQPPVKKGARGGVLPVNTGPVVRGLEAAKARLAGVKVQAADKIGTDKSLSQYTGPFKAIYLDQNSYRITTLGYEIGSDLICGSSAVAFLTHDNKNASKLVYVDLKRNEKTVVEKSAFAIPRSCSPDGLYLLADTQRNCLKITDCQDDDFNQIRQSIIFNTKNKNKTYLNDVLSVSWLNYPREILYRDSSCDDNSLPQISVHQFKSKIKNVDIFSQNCAINESNFVSLKLINDLDRKLIDIVGPDVRVSSCNSWICIFIER